MIVQFQTYDFSKATEITLLKDDIYFECDSSGFPIVYFLNINDKIMIDNKWYKVIDKKIKPNGLSCSSTTLINYIVQECE